MQVFLSRPTWVAPEFKTGIDTLVRQLQNLGLTPRTLGVTDYPSRAPLDEVIQLMSECVGAIVLGVPQIRLEAGSLKGVAIRDPLELATEWNQLEAALAYSAGLPLLVVHHQTITRGIFDRGVLNAFLHRVDMSDSAWSMKEELNGAIGGWKKSCTLGTGNGPQKRQPQSELQGAPKCPNCAGLGRSVFMSPMPPPFNQVPGGNWECKSCNFVQR
jgi:hypothetical protein